ncbi:MAG: 4Fe-4S dicluster domain-containing protein [Synergistaceae bacterium]|jgi:ferredoxin|nr:4Fe-4S dicluster domain-containing protein [Synergistaceae bacterium]
MPVTAKAKRRHYRILAWLRWVIALSALFLSIRVFTSSLLQWQGLRADYMRVQFSGALVRGGPLAAAVLGWLAIAVLFGRWYCGFICPLGTAQEAVRKVSALAARGKLKKFLTPKFISPWRQRYIILILAALGLKAFEPMAIFGHGVRGFFAFAAEGLAAAAPLVLRGAAVFTAVLLFAAARGRRFCDWCPVGIVFGLCSRAAPFGIRLNRDACVTCGNCEKACPMNCVDAKHGRLDRDRCVICLICAKSCVVGALDYGLVSTVDVGRRTFLRKTGNLAAYAAGLAYLSGHPLRRLGRSFLINRLSTGSEPAFIDRVLPPGARNIGRFAGHCISCLACAAACPVGIIQASERYLPYLDYTYGYCQYNCVECGNVCPAGAIHSLPREEKQRTRIALSEFTRPNCVVITRAQSCGACAEVCPTRALRMAPLGDDSPLTVPKFDAEYCIGCGGCLNVCPAEPKAFVMRGVSPQPATPGMRPTLPEESAETPPLPSADGGFPF